MKYMKIKMQKNKQLTPIIKQRTLKHNFKYDEPLFIYTVWLSLSYEFKYAVKQSTKCIKKLEAIFVLLSLYKAFNANVFPHQWQSVTAAF